MEKSGFNTLKYNKSSSLIKLTDVTSLTISNYGASDVTAVVNGISRKIVAFKPAIGVPYGSFNIPGDGTACDLDIRIEMNGTGDVIIDYRKLKPTC